jgi:hypothetical protein
MSLLRVLQGPQLSYSFFLQGQLAFLWALWVEDDAGYFRADVFQRYESITCARVSSGRRQMNFASWLVVQERSLS